MEAVAAAEAEAAELLALARRVDDLDLQAEIGELLAEASLGAGRWDAAEAALSLCVRARTVLPRTTPNGRMLRIAALLVHRRGRPAEARRLLVEAWEAFDREGRLDGRALVENDLRAIALDSGEPGAVDGVLRNGVPPGPRGSLLLARALRRDARFETALRLLRDGLSQVLEPELRFPWLYELVLILRLLGDARTADELLPALRQAAMCSGDPAAAVRQLAVLDPAETMDDAEAAVAGDFESRLDAARRAAGRRDVEAAGALLRDLDHEGLGLRHRAYFELAAGEVELVRAEQSATESRHHANLALAHLRGAAEAAMESSLPEVYVAAVRLAGRIRAVFLQDLEGAVELWGRAERSDDILASRQESDRRRLQMREGSPTAVDEIVAAGAEVALQSAEREEHRGAACLVVALEMARGRTVLSHLLPFAAKALRELPVVGDVEDCWRWMVEQVRLLYRDQAVWFVHASAEQTYHAVIARGFVHWSIFRAGRTELFDAVEELTLAWRGGPKLLEPVLETEPHLMLRCLQRISSHLHLGEVLPALPERVQRLAVIPSGLLNEIPFGALPTDANDPASPLLVEQFAVSGLPCLSALAPLRRRSLASRGEPRDKLEVAPPGLASELSRGSQGAMRLSGSRATVSGVDHALKEQRFPVVQFDCHGRHDRQDAFRSWLQLAPAEEREGRLTAERLAELSLRRCGTLVLGACESGMDRRLGRDEGVGLVRAGLAAGAAAVLAAQWVAREEPTVRILRSFEHYLGWLPRDRALQRSQLDYLACCRDGGGLPPVGDGIEPLQYPEHPARWACWTLSGDAGFQTRAGRLRRWIRGRAWRRRRSPVPEKPRQERTAACR